MLINPKVTHYKDKDPENTVQVIKTLLKQMAIETEEIWQPKSSIDTFALRVVIKNTDTGTNGKGVSKILAEASAYAELMERIQNDLIGNLDIIASESRYSFKLYCDEQFLTAQNIIEDNNSYINKYFEVRGLKDAAIEEKIRSFTSVQKLDSFFFGLSDKYLTVPYYSCSENRLVYLPRNTYRLSYGSNGMSAGNTFEEAVVQALSEIIERYVQQRIIREKISLPDIPLEYVKSFPHVYEMILKFQKNTDYEYLLKDCSLGGRYPVAGLIVIEKNTGHYGIKLGCHPDIGIAMERAFTEAAQGQDIFEYSKRSYLDFFDNNVDEPVNIYNTFKTGHGQYPFCIFDNKPKMPFCEVPSVKGMSNKEIMNRMCNEFLREGFDVLIRDVSYTGFSSIHVIIPGFSEMFFADDQRYRIYNTRIFVTNLFKTPSKINKDNVAYIIAVLEYFSKSVLENSIDSYYEWCDINEIPYACHGFGIHYLVAMCYLLAKNLKKAADYLRYMIANLDDFDTNRMDLVFLKALYYGVTGLEINLSLDAIQKYLILFYDSVVVQKVMDLICDTDFIIIKQYPALNDKYMSSNSSIVNVREALKKMQLTNPIDQLFIGNRIEVKK